MVVWYSKLPPAAAVEKRKNVFAAASATPCGGYQHTMRRSFRTSDAKNRLIWRVMNGSLVVFSYIYATVIRYSGFTLERTF
jgi:hypothetical protein